MDGIFLGPTTCLSPSARHRCSCPQRWRRSSRLSCGPGRRVLGEGDEHTISDLELGKAKSPCEKTVAKLAWGLRLEGSVKDRFVAVPEGCP